MLFIAGGHATYLHIDHVRKMIADKIPLHGFADAGYVEIIMELVIMLYTGIFLMLVMSMENMYKEPSFKLVYYTCTLIPYVYNMFVVFKMQNVTGGLNDDCLADIPTDQHWKCLFVPVSVW